MATVVITPNLDLDRAIAEALVQFGGDNCRVEPARLSTVRRDNPLLICADVYQWVTPQLRGGQRVIGQSRESFRSRLLDAIYMQRDPLVHRRLVDLVRDKLVAVKPNETHAIADHTTGVTQPDASRAILCPVKRQAPR